MPKISVILPTFNAEKYLREAIDSILNQTYGDFELLIIDDGSKDATIEIIDSYADVRVKLVDGPHKGLPAALNAGLDLAQGEYIARMDADDISLPLRFEKQVQYLEQNPQVGLVGTFATIFDETDERPPLLFCGNNKGFESPGLIDALITTIACHPTIMFRRAQFEQLGLRYNEHYRTTEDQEFFARALRYVRFYNLPESLLLYRMSGENATVKKLDNGLQNLLLAQQEILSWLHPTGKYESLAHISDVASRIIKILDEPYNAEKYMSEDERAKLRASKYFERYNIDRPAISFCIGAYNNGQAVCDFAKSVIESDCNFIEVVVVDDCSDDNTQTLLTSLSDKRFKYLRNDEHLGATKTQLSALANGKGEFLYNLKSFESVDTENIKKMLMLLIDLFEEGHFGFPGIYFFEKNINEPSGIKHYPAGPAAYLAFADKPNDAQCIFRKFAWEYCANGGQHYKNGANFNGVEHSSVRDVMASVASVFPLADVSEELVAQTFKTPTAPFSYKNEDAEVAEPAFDEQTVFELFKSNVERLNLIPVYDSVPKSMKSEAAGALYRKYLHFIANGCKGTPGKSGAAQSYTAASIAAANSFYGKCQNYMAAGNFSWLDAYFAAMMQNECRAIVKHYKALRRAPFVKIFMPIYKIYGKILGVLLRPLIVRINQNTDARMNEVINTLSTKFDK